MKVHYRQGDVLILRLDTPLKHEPEPMQRENGRVILAHGEVTGHSHAIADEGVQQYRTAEPGVTALEIETAMAMLKHEEHGTIEIPKGTYEVIRQREYTPTAIINVAD